MGLKDADAQEPFSHGGRCVLPWCKCKGFGRDVCIWALLRVTMRLYEYDKVIVGIQVL